MKRRRVSKRASAKNYRKGKRTSRRQKRRDRAPAMRGGYRI